ncbi:MAG TPA: hypothetical protein VKZ79_23290 [Alphaproteobacteria bacterium]|nr:hypothetical protein [Alphaproteobacteria bacterium]
MDAELITKVARHMVEKHRGEGLRHAVLRAEQLHDDPEAAALWQHVVKAIRVINRMAPTLPNQVRCRVSS